MVQLQDTREFTIAVSKSCCPVCWDIVKIFDRQAQITQGEGSESGNHTPPVHFKTRGRHSNLYAVDLPAILDESIKDKLLTKFSIDLLKDLVSLCDRAAAKPKHVASISNVSQPDVKLKY